MELHELYWSIFISDFFITTDSDLMLLVVGEDSRTLNHSGELKVQQEITIRIEIHVVTHMTASYACLKEVGLAHKQGIGILLQLPVIQGHAETSFLLDNHIFHQFAKKFPLKVFHYTVLKLGADFVQQLQFQSLLSHSDPQRGRFDCQHFAKLDHGR